MLTKPLYREVNFHRLLSAARRNRLSQASIGGNLGTLGGFPRTPPDCLFLTQIMPGAGDALRRELLAAVPLRFGHVAYDCRGETNFHVYIARSAENAERLGHVFVEVEIPRRFEVDRGQLRGFDAIDFPVPDVPMVRSEADQVPRATVVRQRTCTRPRGSRSCRSLKREASLKRGRMLESRRVSKGS